MSVSPEESPPFREGWMSIQHFLHSNIWQDYAQLLLIPAQVNAVDVATLAARFAQNAPS